MENVEDIEITKPIEVSNEDKVKAGVKAEVKDLGKKVRWNAIFEATGMLTVQFLLGALGGYVVYKAMTKSSNVTPLQTTLTDSGVTSTPVLVMGDTQDNRASAVM